MQGLYFLVDVRIYGFGHSHVVVYAFATAIYSNRSAGRKYKVKPFLLDVSGHEVLFNSKALYVCYIFLFPWGALGFFYFVLYLEGIQYNEGPETAGIVTPRHHKKLRFL